MSDILFSAVDCNLPVTSIGKKSTVYLYDLSGKNLLFVHEGDRTCLLHIKHEETGVDVLNTFKSNRCVSNINGNENCVLMLDVTGELYVLQGMTESMQDYFNSLTALNFLDGKATLLWQKFGQLSNCLSMIGIMGAVAFFFHCQSLFCALFRSDEFSYKYSEFSKEKLNFPELEKKYFFSKLKGTVANTIKTNILKSITNEDSECELLVIVASTQILFLLPTPNGQIISQPFSIDLDDNTVVSVFSLDKNNCLLIVCETGKIICLKFGVSKTFQITHIWLPCKVFAVTALELDETILLYSDLNRLYISIMSENKVKNIRVQLNVRGIRHFIQTNDTILAITRNGCIYQTSIKTICCKGEIEGASHLFSPSSEELLNTIYEVGKKVEKLNQEKAEKESLLQALQLSKTPDIKNKINAIVKKGSIIVENKTDFVFKKGLWRLLFEVAEFQRKYTEVRELDRDIVPGGSESFGWDGERSGKLTISLVCCISDATVLISLEPQRVENFAPVENSILADIKQFLNDNCNALY